MLIVERRYTRIRSGQTGLQYTVFAEERYSIYIQVGQFSERCEQVFRFWLPREVSHVTRQHTRITGVVFVNVARAFKLGIDNTLPGWRFLCVD